MHGETISYRRVTRMPKNSGKLTVFANIEIEYDESPSKRILVGDKLGAGIVREVTHREIVDFPEYVKGCSHLMLHGIDREKWVATYFRPNGAWEVKAKGQGGKLITFGHRLEHLNGRELTEASTGEFYADNGYQYSAADAGEIATQTRR